MRLIVGITGASGVVLAVELLKRLREIDSVETHLVITKSAELTIRDEFNRLESDANFNGGKSSCD